MCKGDFLKEVSLHDMRLDPESKHGEAQQTNLEYLLMLDVDSLVWSFRKTAGLPTPGKGYGGHYLSASVQMWASTHNDSLKEKMSAIVSVLSASQDKMGTGYLSAFPSEQFDRFEAIKPVWAPYYTIHMIMAGLLDQYILAEIAQALKMLTWMVDYFYNCVECDNKLYAVTGDWRHLLLAHLFDKPCFLGLLAVKADDISGFHANTHIPVVIGSQMRYEVTGDSLYKEIGTFFMDIVNSSHSYATGGTSVKTRNAKGLVTPAIAAGLGALTHTLGTLVPVIGASGFATATAAAATAIGIVVKEKQVSGQEVQLHEIGDPNKIDVHHKNLQWLQTTFRLQISLDKGQLPDGREVAMKQLSSCSEQAMKRKRKKKTFKAPCTTNEALHLWASPSLPRTMDGASSSV
ncbi:unnamed protein product [Camellia sinensis]